MKFTDKTAPLKLTLKVGDYFLNRDGKVRQLIEIEKELHVLDIEKGTSSTYTSYTSIPNFIERFTQFNGVIVKIHVSEIVFVKSNETVGN